MLKTIILILWSLATTAQPKTQWGMSMEQVKTAEGHHHRYQSGRLDSLDFFHYHTKFYEFKSDMVFYFHQDKLVGVDVIFSESFHHHHYQERFSEMELALKRDYGPSVHADSVMITVRELETMTIEHALMMDPSSFMIRHRPIHTSITHVVKFKPCLQNKN